MVKRLAFRGCGVVLAVGLLVAGCTPESGPMPSPEPSPSISSPVPTPTPSENAQERQQRLDFEAAEKAYLTASRETARLAMAGGTRKPTKTLLATTAGEYLRVQLADLAYLKDKGWRADRPLKTSISANGGWSPRELHITACEDASDVKLINEEGQEVAKSRNRYFVQSLVATKVDGAWKISDTSTKTVKSFSNESACMS